MKESPAVLYRPMRELSVVVACQNARPTVVACLTAMESQNKDIGAEIIVVDNSRDGSAQVVEERFRGVRLIKVAEPRLIPELWAVGAKRALGRIVAFTTAHCIPDAHWLAVMLGDHQSDYAAIGGAIENLRPASPVQWAIYFCRYAAYMLPFAPHPVAQVPGDNASYKRWVLEQYTDLLKAGFWETSINDQLRRDGHSLLMTPENRVYHGRSLGVWAFCRQRLAHGRIFGAQRAAAVSRFRRLLHVAVSPLVPAIFMGRIARQVIGKRRHRREFLLSLPILALFVLSWSLGEFLGYLVGSPPKEELR